MACVYMCVCLCTNAAVRACASSVTPIKHLSLRKRAVLKCQSPKVVALDWSPDSRHVMTASHDGHLLVWNAQQGYKVQAITLPVSWVMCCAYSPSGQYVASGGLDNTCTIYNLAARTSPMDVPVSHSLIQHSGYISACKFLHRDKEILTASGDGSVVHWDVQTERCLSIMEAHRGDVLCLATSPTDPNVFVSGGSDARLHVWDKRTTGAVQTFSSHQTDINAVDMFPDGYAIGSASDDSTCRLFDMRADRDLMALEMGADVSSPATSVSFSKSGRLLFSGYESNKIVVWDTLRGDRVSVLSGHGARIACTRTSPNGAHLATAAWDGKAMVWGI